MRRYGMTGPNGTDRATLALRSPTAERRRRIAGDSANHRAQGQVSSDTVLAQIAALDLMTIAELRLRWRELFGADAPGHSRPYITSRLAYRIQEIAFGGLKPETVAR